MSAIVRWGISACRSNGAFFNRQFSSSFRSASFLSKNAKRNGVCRVSVLNVGEKCCGINAYSHQRRSIVGSAQRTFCQQDKERWCDLSYEQFNALLESQDIVLIDVREPKEIENVRKIPNSINIPLAEIKEALQLPDESFTERYKCEKPQKHSTNLVFYGLCEVKSSAALELAYKLGFKKARHFPGGFEEWCKRQNIVHKEASASGGS